jgi:hypothetical protein
LAPSPLFSFYSPFKKVETKERRGYRLSGEKPRKDERDKMEWREEAARV